VQIRPVPVTLSALTVLAVASGAVLVVAELPDATATTGIALEVLVAGAGLVLAWLIAVKAPGNPVPLALATIAALATATPAVEDWGASADTTDPWPGADIASPLVLAIWPLQLVGFGLLLLTFPGAPLGRRFARRVLVAGGAGTVLILIGNWGTRADAEFTGWRVPVVITGLALLATALLLATVDLVRRSRRAGVAERAQVRWLLLATGCVLVLMVLSWLIVPDVVPPEVGYASFLVALYVLVPTAVAVVATFFVPGDGAAGLITSVPMAAGSVGLGYYVWRYGAFPEACEHEVTWRRPNYVRVPAPVSTGSTSGDATGDATG